MANFAEIKLEHPMNHEEGVTKWVVKRVIKVGEDEVPSDMAVEGEEYCISLFGGTWKQTSWSGSFRGQFAGINQTYDPDKDLFYHRKPYPSWILNETTMEWEAPSGAPDESIKYENYTYDKVIVDTETQEETTQSITEDLKYLYSWDESVQKFKAVLDKPGSSVEYYYWNSETQAWDPIA